MSSVPSRGRPRGRASKLKWGLAALFVIGTGWLTFAVGMSSALREKMPSYAMAVAPFDARAKAASANEIIISGRGRPAARARARELAEAALRRDATVVSAWRALALAGIGGDQQRTARLFRLMSRMSHRDLATQVWLIEESVRRNDISGALHHYDVAVRTTPAAAEGLLAIVADASGSNDVVAPLAAMLRTDPPWRQTFFFILAQRAPSGRNIVQLLQGLGSRRLLPREDIMAMLVDRAAALRDFDSALRIYRIARPGQPVELVRNGGFSGVAPFSVMEWAPGTDRNLSAEQITLADAGDGSVLEIRAEGGTGGIVAQQVLTLSPGRYQLRQQSGALPDIPAAGLSWRVVCINREQSVIAQIAIPASARPATSAVWEVPAQNCAAQWLAITVRADFQAAAVGGWIDSVAISRVAG